MLIFLIHFYSANALLSDVSTSNIISLEGKCFDCSLPDYNCLNFGACDSYSNRCLCPQGFGLADCSGIECGSPLRLNRPIRPDNQKCNCDEGWMGVNCNGLPRINPVCTIDLACSEGQSNDNGTCNNSIIPVKQNYLECEVTNKAVVDLLKGRTPKTTLSCEKENSECHFEFWAGGMESFFCSLHDCDFKLTIQGPKNLTDILCPKVQCKCFPGRLLCGEGNSLDLTEWFKSSDGPKGPGTFKCEESFDSSGKLLRYCIFTGIN